MASILLSARLLAFAVFGISLFPLAFGLAQEPLQVKFRVVAAMIVIPVATERFFSLRPLALSY
jgi:hypothetical protein